MAIIKIKQLLVLGMAASIMVGCASKPTEEAPATAPQAEATQPEQPAAESKSSLSVRDGALYELNANGDYVPVGNGKFYFDYDQSLIKPEAMADLDKHAKFLAENSGASVRLEGHADERGTREYNLALGERRANAVLGYLTSKGAAGTQAEVISYGEEKAVADGHDESAWVQNRRVELIYK